MEGVALGHLSDTLGGELIGDRERRVESIATLEEASAASIAFLANPLYAKQLATTQAGCVIVGPQFRDDAAARGAAIVTPDPYLYFARLTQWWVARSAAAAPLGVDARAVVSAEASMAADASVGACAVIEAGAVLEAGVSIGAHGYVGANCRVGAGTRLAPRVTLLRGTVVGARCLLHSGSVIGADGFGFAPAGGRWEKIEQLGNVRIGDDVEIGANTCIDRGAVGDTIIADGVKIDNLVQIGHNVRIGAHTAIAGCVGIAGSAVIGAHCMIGGGVGINGHVNIADHVHISGATQVTRSIAKAGLYSGLYPFDDNAAWEKNAATLRNLHTLRTRIQALEKKSR